jgi:hypothetical protein
MLSSHLPFVLSSHFQRDFHTKVSQHFLLTKHAAQTIVFHDFLQFFHFVFRRSHVQILARRLAILTEVFSGFPRTIQANAGLVF